MYLHLLGISILLMRGNVVLPLSIALYYNFIFDGLTHLCVNKDLDILCLVLICGLCSISLSIFWICTWKEWSTSFLIVVFTFSLLCLVCYIIDKHVSICTSLADEWFTLGHHGRRQFAIWVALSLCCTDETH